MRYSTLLFDLDHTLFDFDTSELHAFEAALAVVGIEAELLEPEPGRTSVVARWEPEGVDRSLSPLLVHGHLDVVPANADDWLVPPFAGEVV